MHYKYKILDLIYDRYASLPLDKLLEYPIKIAKDGFKLTQPTKDYFLHSLEPMFMWHEYSKEVLNNVYKNLDSGIVKLEKLSDTYSYMSTEGFNDFYHGDISKSILQTVEQEGGHATAADFNNYDFIIGPLITRNFNYFNSNNIKTKIVSPLISSDVEFRENTIITTEPDSLKRKFVFEMIDQMID